MKTSHPSPYPLPLIIWIISSSILLGAILFPFISSNIAKIVYSFNTGIETQIIPKPLYGFFRPSVYKPTCKDFTFGADFGDVYYPSKYFFNGDLYTTTKYDVWERAVHYPPLLCYIYNKTLCRFPYPRALILQLSVQIILLLLASFYVLNYYRLNFLALPVALIYFVIIFLTPVGLTWVERGQCDIYSALAVLFFIFAVYESKAYAFVLSALFASLKPTIAPFFVQAFTVYLLVEFKPQKLYFFFLFTGIVALTLLIFPQYNIAYLTSMYNSRSMAEGITLVGKMPSTVILLIPVISLLIYLIPLCLSRRKHVLLKTFLPYMTGLVIIDILLPFTSWEYRTICFLGFIPMVIPWLTRFSQDRIYNQEFISLFLLFLFIAFHGFWVISPANPAWEYFIASYFAYFSAIAVISVSRINSPALHLQGP